MQRTNPEIELLPPSTNYRKFQHDCKKLITDQRLLDLFMHFTAFTRRLHNYMRGLWHLNRVNAALIVHVSYIVPAQPESVILTQNLATKPPQQSMLIFGPAWSWSTLFAVPSEIFKNSSLLLYMWRYLLRMADQWVYGLLAITSEPGSNPAEGRILSDRKLCSISHSLSLSPVSQLDMTGILSKG